MGSDSSKNKLYNLILESQISLYDKNKLKDITRIEPKKIDDEDIENVNNLNTFEKDEDELFQDDSLIKNYKVENINKYPENCIGQIECIKNGKQFKSTGCLIGENLVLTLASNIYDIKTNSFSTEIIYKHSNGKKYEPIKNNVTKIFGNNHLSRDNWATLIFNEEISKSFLGVEFIQIETLPSIDIHIYGYNLNNELYYGYTNAETQDDNVITYKIPLKEGESGSPLIQKIEDKYYVFGLNLSCNENDNKGNIFEKDIIDKIYYIKEKKRKFIDESKVFVLDLSNQNLFSNDIEYFNCYNFINIQELNLSQNHIGVQGMYNLKNARLQSLKKLNLDLNELGDKGISYIFQCNFTTLTELTLSNNNISYIGINDLCKCDFKHTLIKLDLSENIKIGDKGIENLVNTLWDKLYDLIIIKINLTNNGLHYFRKTNIKKILMQNHKLTKDAENILYSLKLDNKQIITGIPKFDK
jgi:V8-like Glu-specific endopeptidase